MFLTFIFITNIDAKLRESLREEFSIKRFLNIFDFIKEIKIYFKRESNKHILSKTNSKILNAFLIYKISKRSLINY